MLNADGRLNLTSGYAGPLDPRGWWMQTDGAGRPRLAPAPPGDENWDPRFTPPGGGDIVDAIAISGTTTFLAGGFTTAGGGAAIRIAAWDGSSWSALGSGLNSYVFALAVSGSTLYAGGNFTTAGGGVANRIAAWNGSSWSALAAGQGLS